ncbi:MAG: hypothetical protein ACJ752_10635 [Gaiellaceae bacterium]
MPTWAKTDEFKRNWAKLSDKEKQQFLNAVREFREDLPSGQFRKGLRVKGYKSKKGVNEMTWADDGRALWTYGPEQRSGEPHIIWLAIGGHDIF